MLPHSVLDDDLTPKAIAIEVKQSARLHEMPTASLIQAEVNTAGSVGNLSLSTAILPPHNLCSIDNARSSPRLQKRTPSMHGSQTTLCPASPRPGSRGSHRSRGSKRRKGSKESLRRGEKLMEMARGGSFRSRDSLRSHRDSKKSSRRRKDSNESTLSNTSSLSRRSGLGKTIARNGRNGYMSAHEAVALGDKICGCLLKARVLYFVKPAVFLSIGLLLIIGGVVLTVLHFMYEDVVGEKGGPKPKTNVPYFTWGPITLSTGVIVFMIGLVWFPIKEKKWKDGKASPMLDALETFYAESEKREIKMADQSSNEIDRIAQDIHETRLDIPEYSDVVDSHDSDKKYPPHNL